MAHVSLPADRAAAHDTWCTTAVTRTSAHAALLFVAPVAIPDQDHGTAVGLHDTRLAISMTQAAFHVLQLFGPESNRRRTLYMN